MWNRKKRGWVNTHLLHRRLHSRGRYIGTDDYQMPRNCHLWLRVYKNFSKNEQRAEIQSSQEDTDLKWNVKIKTHLQEHQWTLHLTPTWNHKKKWYVKWHESFPTQEKWVKEFKKPEANAIFIMTFMLFVILKSIMGTSAQSPFPLKIGARREL